MSDEENERFDVDNDYEGMQWIGGEAFYGSKRKKRQQTAEDRIYGVFAENSSDDEDERRRGRKREKKDYAKPVDFVSSGSFVQQPPEEQQAAAPEQRPAISKAKQPGKAQDGVGSNGATAGLGSAGLGFGGGGGGLGFGGGGGGLGFGGGGLGFAPANGAGNGAGGADAQEEEEVVLPSAFGKRIKRQAEERQKAEQQASAKSSKGRGAVASGLAPTGDFATFEKHTKGIGLKLLGKMGYKAGQGLGREGTGIARPLETKLRPKNMGLGAGRFEEAKMELPKTAAQQALAAAEEAEEGSAAARAGGKASTSGNDAAATKLWKRRAAPQRQARTYKTAAEVLAEAAEKPTVMQQPILDMRGPQARLVTNLEHLNVEDAAGEAGAGGPPMPELQHNLTLLVDLTQAQLQQLDAKLQHEQDTATLLAAEKTRLEAEAARQEAALSRLANLASDVARTAAHAPTSSLHHLRDAYAAMQSSYPQEYIMYSISSAALAHALPHFASLMRGWAPLQEPTRGAEEFREWRALLEGEGAKHAVLSGADGLGGGDEDAYVALVLEVLLPPIRSAVTTTWQARVPEPMLALIDTWEPLLPHSVISLILNSLVMPKLTAAVGTWEPRQEAVPIHAWLHPWLPHLGTALESVYPSIRHKLSLALSAWHPSDGSAALLLAPWQRAFAAADWEALLTRSIAPKLAEALNELVVNPLAQDLEPLNWVLAWHGLLPGQVMAGLLDAGFFPRWHAVLRHWLSGAPNFDEVTRWYLGWKGLFPQDLLDQERVRANFNHALNMMNSAADGAPLPPPAPAAVPGVGGAAAAGAAGGAAPISNGRGGFVPELSLRELVARFSEESGVEFLPKPGRYHDGLQVYSFGGVSVVLDASSSSVRAQIRERWAPVSLDRLLQEARSRGKK